jgi:hypothetical protein
MRRYGLSAIIALALVGLGVVTISRGQFWLGACLIGLAVLRTFLLLQGRSPRKPQPSIRLSIEDESTRSDGSEEHPDATKRPQKAHKETTAQRLANAPADVVV